MPRPKHPLCCVTPVGGAGMAAGSGCSSASRLVEWEVLGMGDGYLDVREQLPGSVLGSVTAVIGRGVVSSDTQLWVTCFNGEE